MLNARANVSVSSITLTLVMFTLTTTRTRAGHPLVPPHTPQLSVPPYMSQQRPEGETGVRQQTPRASIPLDVPLQLPQPSNHPEQQRPSRDTTKSASPQHSPLLESMAFRQHRFAASSTPSAQGALADTSPTVSHFSPSHPGLHTHRLADKSQWAFNTQSASMLHSHGTPVSHGRHKLSLTVAPLTSIQLTERVINPLPHPFVDAQPLADDTNHLNTRLGQGNRLHGRVMLGKARPVSKQTKSSTCDAPNIHTGTPLRLVIPNCDAVPSSQGWEHGVHRLETDQ
jgi:hypothetical protein